MRLSTRIALITASGLVIGGTAIGWSTALITRNDSISNVDDALIESITALEATSPNDPFGIVEIAQRSPFPVAASLVFEDSAPIPLVTQFSSNGTSLMPELSAAEIIDAQKSPSSRSTDGGVVRVATLDLGDGSWLAIASSVEEIESRYRSTLELALGASVAIALFLAAIVAWLIARQFRPLGELIDSARKIATGTFVRDRVRRTAPLEILELDESLDLMIGELSAAMESRVESERRMREFLGDTAHELRTPLTVIRGYVEILQRNEHIDDEVRDRALSRLDGETKRMTRLLNDLLLLAELNEAPREQALPVDLAELVRTRIDDLRLQEPSRHVTLEGPDSVLVVGYHEQLERLVANIIANVQRHTPSTARVVVTITEDPATATLACDDDGTGMSPETLERVNHGVVRFASERNRNAGGSGLGLPIIQSIVRQHGGSIQFLKSTLGGLRVTITLPKSK